MCSIYTNDYCFKHDNYTHLNYQHVSNYDDKHHNSSYYADYRFKYNRFNHNYDSDHFNCFEYAHANHIESSFNHSIGGQTIRTISSSNKRHQIFYSPVQNFAIQIFLIKFLFSILKCLFVVSLIAALLVLAVILELILELLRIDSKSFQAIVA